MRARMHSTTHRGKWGLREKHPRLWCDVQRYKQARMFRQRVEVRRRCASSWQRRDHADTASAR
eukprot:6215-Eustigmatos_ZCMA.PRE.1